MMHSELQFGQFSGVVSHLELVYISSCLSSLKITVMPFHAPFADWPFALMFWHKRALSQSLDLLGKHPFRWLAGKSKHLRCRALAL